MKKEKSFHKLSKEHLAEIDQKMQFQMSVLSSLEGNQNLTINLLVEV